MGEYDPLELETMTDARGIAWFKYPTDGPGGGHQPSWAIRFGFPADSVGRYTGPNVPIYQRPDGRWYFSAWRDEEGYATRGEAMMSERTLTEIRRVFRRLEESVRAEQAKLDQALASIPTGTLA